MKDNLKATIQSAIRQVHLQCLNRGLPNRVAFFFHAIGDQEWNLFRRAIQFFHNEGYEFVDPATFVSETGKRLAFVSFDDNFQCWHRNLDVFSELGIQATFYVNYAPCRDLATKQAIEEYFDRLLYFGDRMTMSTAEIVELANAGHTIGNHTLSHYCLSDIDKSSARAEILKGKESLEALLGSEVSHFSYPFGRRRHMTAGLNSYCGDIEIQSISSAIHGMHSNCVDDKIIHRTAWRLDQSLGYNIANLSVDGRVWEHLTGRNAVI